MSRITRERFEAVLPSIQDRFPDFVSKSDGCWEWTGHADKDGYGWWGFSEHNGISAHRASLFIASREWPEAVFHHCDNRLCVRPNHLFPGTRADNNRDMFTKGRDAWSIGTANVLRGSANGNAVLNEAQVQDIRLRIARKEQQKLIAAHYSVSRALVSGIHKGRLWNHVAA